ncbi:hypothetical protein B23_2223 [Geobacillus thermoleovorans B23]|nr:hypothetical protein B23_2223 [Geobacillus thermoleovorans B23]
MATLFYQFFCIFIMNFFANGFKLDEYLYKKSQPRR